MTTTYTTLAAALPKSPGMYIISNPERTQCYVGSTGNLYSRQRAHRVALKNLTNNANQGVQILYNQYGLNLIVEYAIANDREHAYDLEQAYLDEHYGQPYLLNKAKDARLPGIGRIVSEDHKESTRQRSLGNKYCEGKVWSDESRKKASESAKKKVVSDAARAAYRANAIRHHGKSILCKNYANQTLTIYECAPDIEKELGIPAYKVNYDLKNGSIKLRGGCVFKYANANDPEIGVWPVFTQEEGIHSREEYLAYLNSPACKPNSTKVHMFNVVTKVLTIFPTITACAKQLDINTGTLQYIMGLMGNKKLKRIGDYVIKSEHDNRDWIDAVMYNPTVAINLPM